jgi:hypothetical protein
MTSHPVAKAGGQLSVQSIFFTPLRLKVSARIGFLRQALRTETNERRAWGKNVAGIFWGRLSH